MEDLGFLVGSPTRHFVNKHDNPFEGVDIHNTSAMIQPQEYVSRNQVEAWQEDWAHQIECNQLISAAVQLNSHKGLGAQDVLPQLLQPPQCEVRLHSTCHKSQGSSVMRYRHLHGKCQMTSLLITQVPIWCASPTNVILTLLSSY